MSKTPMFTSWQRMISRCTNPGDDRFEYYGGRGIRVCERWLKFEDFLADMGLRPKGMSIDRIDNDGDYCKDNCRWASVKEQCRNRRSNVVIEWRGQKKILKEWSEELGISYTVLQTRIHGGWTIERAFTSR